MPIFQRVVNQNALCSTTLKPISFINGILTSSCPIKKQGKQKKGKKEGNKDDRKDKKDIDLKIEDRWKEGEIKDRKTVKKKIKEIHVGMEKEIMNAKK